MFAWLSSTYRIPPKQEEDNQADDDLLSGGQDLPTAMKYRFLKNTAKDHVGVYRFVTIMLCCKIFEIFRLNYYSLSEILLLDYLYLAGK